MHNPDATKKLLSKRCLVCEFKIKAAKKVPTKMYKNTKKLNKKRQKDQLSSNNFSFAIKKTVNLAPTFDN